MTGVAAIDPRRVSEEGLEMLERCALLGLATEPAFDRLTSGLRRAMGAGTAAIFVLDAGRVLVKSLCDGAGAARRVTEVELDEALKDVLLGRSGVRIPADGGFAYCETPIVVDGELLGGVSIADPGRRDWDAIHVRILEDAAAAVVTELRLRLARDDAARTHELVAAHSKVHELIAAGAPLDDVLLELVSGIQRHDPSLLPCVVLLDRESGTLHPSAGPSLPPWYLAAIDGVVIGPNVGTCGSAAWSGALTLTEDVGTDPRWALIPALDDVLEAGPRHCRSMPIKSSDDEVLGTLALYGQRPRSPLPEHLTLMTDSARIAEIAIERHRSLQQLIHDARNDSLTGLPNRTRIFEALEDAIIAAHPETQVAVMFVDLDSLKQLNDNLGHDRADDVIREIGDRLSSTVRDRDFVGRFGGDEFIVIAEGMTDTEEAASLGSRLLDAISQPLPGIDSTVVTASIGIALLSGPDVDAREALRQADSAMYDAKRSGHDRCAFYHGTQRVQAGRRLAIARGLRNAELRGELHLVFQPVFDLASSEISGVEALLRWTSPTLGEVSPAEFIPIAEDTGAIVPIGAWVLRESCEALALAHAESQIATRLELGVNISAHQVARAGFAQSVRQTLAHTRFPAHLLTLEITESALMRPDSVTVRTLRELGTLGARIVLDDFGTGFSSLSWLKRHPLDAIKVDRSFITDLAKSSRDSAIVAAVITMARALECTVTAEGVETEDQLTTLRELDCHRAQGFLLARPQPIEQLLALLHSHEWRS